ncbi:MAG TPA: class IV adenylate cyclase [Candidatus Eisenbacteria bacterium]|nr:class IV adenylate cyclase [Candidatus Eisenbacteria bacterium]
MQNIEIKAQLGDPAVMARRAEGLGASRRGELRQRDTFFHVPRGYLKLREIEGQAGELIAYTRDAGTGPRASDYVVAQVGDTRKLCEALARSLGVRGRVEKVRTLYLWKHTRIHLDKVAGLGTFLELETVMDGIDREAAEAEAWSLIRALDLDPGTFLDVPYLELLEVRGGSVPLATEVSLQEEMR